MSAEDRFGDQTVFQTTLPGFDDPGAVAEVLAPVSLLAEQNEHSLALSWQWAGSGSGKYVIESSLDQENWHHVTTTTSNVIQTPLPAMPSRYRVKACIDNACSVTSEWDEWFKGQFRSINRNDDSSPLSAFEQQMLQRAQLEPIAVKAAKYLPETTIPGMIYEEYSGRITAAMDIGEGLLHTRFKLEQQDRFTFAAEANASDWYAKDVLPVFSQNPGCQGTSSCYHAQAGIELDVLTIDRRAMERIPNLRVPDSSGGMTLLEDPRAGNQVKLGRSNLKRDLTFNSRFRRNAHIGMWLDHYWTDEKGGRLIKDEALQNDGQGPKTIVFNEPYQPSYPIKGYDDYRVPFEQDTYWYWSADGTRTKYRPLYQTTFGTSADVARFYPVERILNGGKRTFYHYQVKTPSGSWQTIEPDTPLDNILQVSGHLLDVRLSAVTSPNYPKSLAFDYDQDTVVAKLLLNNNTMEKQWIFREGTMPGGKYDRRLSFIPPNSNGVEGPQKTTHYYFGTSDNTANQSLLQRIEVQHGNSPVAVDLTYTRFGSPYCAFDNPVGYGNDSLMLFGFGHMDLTRLATVSYDQIQIGYDYRQSLRNGSEIPFEADVDVEPNSREGAGGYIRVTKQYQDSLTGQRFGGSDSYYHHSEFMFSEMAMMNMTVCQASLFDTQPMTFARNGRLFESTTDYTNTQGQSSAITTKSTFDLRLNLETNRAFANTAAAFTPVVLAYSGVAEHSPDVAPNLWEMQAFGQYKPITLAPQEQTQWVAGQYAPRESEITDYLKLTTAYNDHYTSNPGQNTFVKHSDPHFMAMKVATEKWEYRQNQPYATGKTTTDYLHDYYSYEDAAGIHPLHSLLPQTVKQYSNPEHAQQKQFTYHLASEANIDGLSPGDVAQVSNSGSSIGYSAITPGSFGMFNQQVSYPEGLSEARVFNRQMQKIKTTIDGVVTQFSYDSLGRLRRSHASAADGSHSLLAAGKSIEYVSDQETRSGLQGNENNGLLAIFDRKLTNYRGVETCTESRHEGAVWKKVMQTDPYGNPVVVASGALSDWQCDVGSVPDNLQIQKRITGATDVQGRQVFQRVESPAQGGDSFTTTTSRQWQANAEVAGGYHYVTTTTKTLNGSDSTTKVTYTDYLGRTVKAQTGNNGDAFTRVTHSHQNNRLIKTLLPRNDRSVQRIEQYDWLGRLVEADDPETPVYRFSYDQQGRLSEKVAVFDDGSQSVVERVEYDALDRPLRTYRGYHASDNFTAQDIPLYQVFTYRGYLPSKSITFNHASPSDRKVDMVIDEFNYNGVNQLIEKSSAFVLGHQTDNPATGSQGELIGLAGQLNCHILSSYQSWNCNSVETLYDSFGRTSHKKSNPAKAKEPHQTVSLQLPWWYR